MTNWLFDKLTFWLFPPFRKSHIALKTERRGTQTIAQIQNNNGALKYLDIQTICIGNLSRQLKLRAANYPVLRKHRIQLNAGFSESIQLSLVFRHIYSIKPRGKRNSFNLPQVYSTNPFNFFKVAQGQKVKKSKSHFVIFKGVLDLGESIDLLIIRSLVFWEVAEDGLLACKFRI